jgi:rubrerythrin
MITEFLLFFINIGLIAFLIYRERQHERQVREVLAARLSRDASEFKAAVEESKPAEPDKPEPVEIPLEDAPAEDILGAFKKK